MSGGQVQTFRLSELGSHRWEVRAQPAPWWGGIELMTRTLMYDGQHGYVKDIILEEIDEFTEAPSFPLNMKAAQVLMDDLWASGVRPTEKRQDGEALRSVRDHLSDMQKVAFRLLDDKLGEGNE